MNKLQYKAIRLALGYRNSTPINVLLAEAKEPTLNIRFDYLANKLAVKLISLDDDRLSNLLCDLYLCNRQQQKLHSLNTAFPLFKNYIQCFYKKNHIVKKFAQPLPYPFERSTLTSNLNTVISTEQGQKIKKSTNSIEEFKHAFQQNNHNYIDFYTDGSKIEHGDRYSFPTTKTKPKV